MQVTAFIGDVHGCVKSLESLLNRLLKHYSIQQFVFVGDLIDRGNYCKEVLQLVTELKNDFTVEVMLGNHEDMMLDFANGICNYEKNDWLNNGGRETIISISGERLYNRFLMGEDVFRAFSDDLKQFESILNDLKLYEIVTFKDQKILVSHAGISDFSKPPEKQLEGIDESLRKIKYPFIWDREIIHKNERYFDYVIIYGHTPVHKIITAKDKIAPLFKKDESGNITIINVDTGCVYGEGLSAVLTENGVDFEWETVKCKK